MLDILILLFFVVHEFFFQIEMIKCYEEGKGANDKDKMS